MKWLTGAAAILLLLARQQNEAVAADGPTSAPTTAAEAYELGYVGMREMVQLDSNGGRTWSAYRGKYRETLDGAAFYDAVDRPDLANSYRARHVTKVSLLLGGVAVGAAGFVLFADEARSTGQWLVLAGLASSIASLFINPDPVGETEARRLADEHNKALRRRLDPPPPPRPAVTAWRLSPVVSPATGGFMLSASF